MGVVGTVDRLALLVLGAAPASPSGQTAIPARGAAIADPTIKRTNWRRFCVRAGEDVFRSWVIYCSIINATVPRVRDIVRSKKGERDRANVVVGAGSPAISATRPVALRPHLSMGLPFRS